MGRIVTFATCVAVFVASASGCGGSSVVDELGPALKRLAEPGGATLPNADDLYAILDQASRAAVDERARALSKALGREVRPLEAFQFRGMSGAQRISDVELVEESETQATLRVSLARVGEDSPGTLMPEPLTLTAVREDGRWKVRLPGVAEALGAAQAAPPETPRGTP